MKRQLVTVPMMLLSCAAWSGELVLPAAPNCALVSPPAGTKGRGSHAGIIFGYPESPGRRYTGCFHLWIAEDREGQDWGFKMTTYFVDGDPQMYVERIQETGRGEGEVGLECRYEKGRTVFEKRYEAGDGVSNCPDTSTLREALKGKESK